MFPSHDIDKDHKEYNPTVLCSAGIGAGYINRQEAKNNKFKGIHTKETYTQEAATFEDKLTTDARTKVTDFRKNSDS